MPRPILRPIAKTESQENSRLSLRETSRSKTKVHDTLLIDRLLRKPRSQAYLEKIHQLDAGGHVNMKQQVQDLVDILQKEYPEVELPILSILQGFVAKCYLGGSYEVHTVDVLGNIICHYERGQALPGDLEKARGLAYSGFYEVIEVYTDCCRAIAADGTVSVIRN